MPEAADRDNVTFIPLRDHTTPSLPTEETLRRWVGNLRGLFGTDEAEPFMADDRLQKATMQRLDEVIAPPACGPLLDELDRTIAQWLDSGPHPQGLHIKVVVLPPCEESVLLQTWAQQAGHQVLPPPPRDRLVTSAAVEIPRLDEEDRGRANDNDRRVLVVPRLEDWLLRHRNGLDAVRRLLAALDALHRPVVIGCNSWAWALLGKATGAHLLLPEPITFEAFDAARLHRWFAELARADSTGAVRFRLPSTGEDVLAQNAQGAFESDYLEKLAGRGLGIPWVAWHLWRRSMRADKQQAQGKDAEAGDDPQAGASEPQQSADTKAKNDQQTLWIAELDDYRLPPDHEQMALLTLQALLIHGAMTASQLRLVLPVAEDAGLLPALVHAGFLTRDGEHFGCAPAAYPAMRSALAAAGFSMDGF